MQKFFLIYNYIYNLIRKTIEQISVKYGQNWILIILSYNIVIQILNTFILF